MEGRKESNAETEMLWIVPPTTSSTSEGLSSEIKGSQSRKVPNKSVSNKQSTMLTSGQLSDLFRRLDTSGNTNINTDTNINTNANNKCKVMVNWTSKNFKISQEN